MPVKPLISFEQVIDFENLYRAYQQAKKGQANKRTVWRFEQGLFVNLETLRKRLTNKTYRVGKYHIFRVMEPKERVIMALPFVDRIVQHALCLVIMPRLEEHFVSANCANRVKKGTHFAIKMFTKQLADCHRELTTKKLATNENLWCLKCDIKGFFYNIDRERMKEKLERVLGFDQEIMWLIRTIIDSSPDIVDKELEISREGKGLPIGNLTSQFFAIFYLSALDHFIKEKLRIKHYVRYMDDFVLLHQDKKYLQKCLAEIKEFLTLERLELNRKTEIFAMKQGVDFLGWHFYLREDTGKVIRLLRKDSKERRRRKNRKFIKNYQKEKSPKARAEMLRHFRQSFASWLGHISHGHTYFLQKKIEEEVEGIL
jgi:hypothetical protein